jgi:N-acetylmuramoyl-L-alanine amidase
MLAATPNTVFEQKLSGNHGGKIREHKYLVMHYTGGDRLDNAVAWLRTPASRVSANALIGQEGRIVQLVPWDVVAWHAGESKYGEDRGLNSLSIGI